MNGKTTVETLLKELEGVLAAYGADAQRWPGDRRAELTAFAASNAEARRLCETAAAVDRLLDAAAGQSEQAPIGLMSRIMSEVQAEHRVAADRAGEGKPVAEVVSIRAARLQPAQAMGDADRAAPADKQPQPSGWASMAMLAASLVLGVLIGGTGQLNGALEQIGLLNGQPAAVESTTVLLSPMLDSEEPIGDDIL